MGRQFSTPLLSNAMRVFFDTCELDSYWVKPITSLRKKIKVGIILTFVFFYLVRKKNLTVITKIYKNQHMCMASKFLSEIFRIAFFATGIALNNHIGIGKCLENFSPFLLVIFVLFNFIPKRWYIIPHLEDFTIFQETTCIYTRISLKFCSIVTLYLISGIFKKIQPSMSHHSSFTLDHRPSQSDRNGWGYPYKSWSL